MKYQLRNMRGDVLSEHPNQEGAQLSALHHVQNGDKIQWILGLGTVWGCVNCGDIRAASFEIWQRET